MQMTIESLFDTDGTGLTTDTRPPSRPLKRKSAGTFKSAVAEPIPHRPTPAPRAECHTPHEEEIERWDGLY
ncbi:MAG: hypothetical protein ACTHLN_06295 [Tepidisphaeraceae bacterium]